MFSQIRFYPLLLLLLSVTAQRPAFAETITILGLPFKLDQRAPATGGMVRVRIASEERLVPEQEVENFVVDYYFAEAQRTEQFPDAELEGFLLATARAKQEGWFERAFAVWLTRPTHPSAGRRIVRAVLAAGGTSKLVASALELAPVSLADRRVLAETVFELKLHDPNLKIAAVVSERKRIGEPLREIIVEEVRRAAEDRRIEVVEAQTSIAGALLGDRDELTQSIGAIAVFLRSANSAIEKLSASALQDALDRLEVAQQARSVLGPALPAIVHDAARSFLEQGRSTEALAVLTYIAVGARTPSTHEILRRSLETIEPGAESPLQRPAVRDLSLGIALNDSQVGAALQAALERQLRWGVAQLRTDYAEIALRELVGLRPDPSRENDRLRFELARAYHARGLKLAAAETLEAMQTGMTFGERVRGIIAGMFVPLSLLITILLVPVVTCFLVIRRHRRAEQLKLTRQEQIVAEQSAAIEDERVRPRGFSFHGRQTRNNPAVQEYVAALRVFGLAEKASFKEIKTSYRQMVKSVHPDSTVGNSEESTDRFIKLNKLYERILELRAALGLPIED